MSEPNKQVWIGICGDVWLATECLYGDLELGDLWFRRGIGGIEQLVREFSERPSVTLKTGGSPAYLPHKQVYRLELVQHESPLSGESEALSGESEETSQPADDSGPQTFAIWRKLQGALDEELSKLDEVEAKREEPQKLVLKGRWERVEWSAVPAWQYFVGGLLIGSVCSCGMSVELSFNLPEATDSTVPRTWFFVKQAAVALHELVDQAFAKTRPHIVIEHPAFPEVE